MCDRVREKPGWLYKGFEVKRVGLELISSFEKEGKPKALKCSERLREKRTPEFSDVNP